jgi:hypothetical protein
MAVTAILGGVLVPVGLPEAGAQEGHAVEAGEDLDIQEIKDLVKTPMLPGGTLDVAAGASSFASDTPFGAPDLGGGKATGTNVQVSQDQDPNAFLRSGASEVSIASTLFGLRSVIGWNDGEGFAFAPFVADQPPLGLSGYGFSSDGGRTWTDGGAPPLGSKIGFGPGTQGQSETGIYVTRGDPWLDADYRGTYYYANLSVWEDDAVGPPAGISVHTGSFRGRNFSWSDSVLVQSPNYPNDFLDKEAMAVDRRGRDTAIYVTTTNFEETCNVPTNGFGTIELYRSLDSGDTWDRTIIQPDETFVTDPDDPACGTDGIVNQGSAPAVGPGGELYTVWERGWQAPLAGGSVLPRATIAFAASRDKGATFMAPVEVASICSGTLDEPAGYNRTAMNDFPRIDVAQSGRHRGRIFVTYQDCSAAAGEDAPFAADTDVYVTYSDDKGATWSTPTPLHPVADGAQQFWPAVSTGSLGTVDVTYYEMRDVNLTPDPDDIECSVRVGGTLDEPVLKESTLTTFSDVMHVRSTNGGRTWSTPERVTDTSTNCCAATPINSIIPNFGDYNDSLTTGLLGRTLYATWADGRNADIVDRVPTAFFGRAR